jgi:oligosaccharide repeat unit polymerase
MSLLLISVISILGIILGKFLFKKWFNPLTLYCLIMGGLVFLFELKLLPYPDLIPLAWFMIITSFLAFAFGIITMITAKNLYSDNQSIYIKKNISLKIFADGGKTIKYSILFFSFIGLFVALHRWYVLIGKFGSIQDVIINAAVVYRLNVQGDIKEFIPILPIFIYVGVFLSGLYTAYKGKSSFISYLPIITIILKEMTYFGRGEILFSSMEFIFTFILFRHLLKTDSYERFKFSKINALVAAIFLLAILLAASSFIRVSRSAKEDYIGTNRNLKQLKGNFLLSPSVYLYLSSDVAVLSKYLELENEETSFGQNTLRPFYDILSRTGVVKKAHFFQKGYYVPMWVNTGTYIRELHADFGITGVLLIPYLLGFSITWLWFRFYQGRSIYTLVLLVYLFLIIGFSFIMMITRLNIWLFSQALILLYLPILQKLANRKYSIISLKA